MRGQPETVEEACTPTPPQGLIAHTPGATGHWHTLADHLVDVAELAARFGAPLGLDEVAYWAGLWHDIGKASCVFQEYLARAATDPSEARRRYPSRDHKHAGTLIALDSKLHAAAFAIMGHHGGIPNATTIKTIARTEDLADYGDLIERVAAALDTGIRPSRPVRTEPTDGLLDQEMLTRFLTSCLVDADYLDTARHFQPAQHRARQSATLGEVYERFTQRHATMLAGAEHTPVNEARTLWANEAVARATTSRSGVYRLTGPTGIGKTIGGMAAALAHAASNGQARVIVATPYMSVTDQTAMWLRYFCDPDATEPHAAPAVLEHHSTSIDTHEHSWDRLAAENWDAPVVVTTTVQLLESLFANKPGRLRKLHRLSNAVIIIDEPQTIPAGVLEPVISALNWLVKHANTTVVLQTATQPKFEHIGDWIDATIADWGTLNTGPAMQRVTWTVDPTPVSHAVIAERLGDAHQVLCVANTIRDALAIHAASPPDTLYLTTRLTKSHRGQVLDEVRTRLAEGRPCRLVATQLVEAGMDLDFPEVHRAIGPLTSLAQAAGRCNRNGHLDTGQVRVFELEGGRTPAGEYAIGTAATRNIMGTYGEGFDPEAPEQLAAWYDIVYGTGATNAQRFDADDIQTRRLRFDFPAVAELRLIKQVTIPVLVRRGTDAEVSELDRIIDQIESGEALYRRDWRFLGRMSVAIPANKVKESEKDFTMIQAPGGTESGVLSWSGVYDPNVGIVFSNDA